MYYVINCLTLIKHFQCTLLSRALSCTWNFQVTCISQARILWGHAKIPTWFIPSMVLASILHGPCKILHVHRKKLSISYLHISCKNLVRVCQDACKITAWFLHVSYVGLVRIIQGPWQETCQAFGQNLVSFSYKTHECEIPARCCVCFLPRPSDRGYTWCMWGYRLLTCLYVKVIAGRNTYSWGI